MGKNFFKSLEEDFDEETEECSKCKSMDIEFTTMGFKPPNPDPNRRTCLNCGHKWYLEEYLLRS